MVSRKGQKIRKCFLSEPVMHDPFNMLAPAILSTQTCLLSADDTPYITAVEQEESPSTLHDRRTMYLHTGQYDQTSSKKQL